MFPHTLPPAWWHTASRRPGQYGNVYLYKNLGGFNFDEIICSVSASANYGLTVADFNNDGIVDMAFGEDPIVVVFDAPSSFGTKAVDDKDFEIPTQFSLHQNYPNPFNPSTTIRFSLPRAAQVKLTVFNVLGQQVAELLNERKPAGEHSVTFDARNLSSGVYYYRLEAGDPSAGSGQRFREVRKMVLVR